MKQVRRTPAKAPYQNALFNLSRNLFLCGAGPIDLLIGSLSGTAWSNWAGGGRKGCPTQTGSNFGINLNSAQARHLCFAQLDAQRPDVFLELFRRRSAGGWGRVIARRDPW